MQNSVSPVITDNQACQAEVVAVKCIYCRTEFQQNIHNAISSVCKTCAHFVKLYGKPTQCEYCKDVAAFLNRKCYRCTRQERKYGPPTRCTDCLNLCAFRHPSHNSDGSQSRLFCWQCSLKHKRTRAKQDPDAYSPTSVTPIYGRSTAAETPGSARDSFERPSPFLSSVSETSSIRMQGAVTPGSDGYADGGSRSRLNEVGSDCPAKKTRTEKVAVNGWTAVHSTDAVSDLISTQQLITIDKLNETVSQLKRQIQTKDQQLLQREQQITQLKAQNFEMEKETRHKLQKMQRQYEQAMESLQTKNRELQRQLEAKMSKRDSSVTS